ncbi:hypothetical protein GGE12_006240 [Rhizobium mongolense]|uniref:Uncharacterized protein n=1 Tax=Rhizobium mongolense TaxID=57676 RepID=A0A7W6RTM6_9HYPH|nr:hypothetical protein [Rhizobium mongolense]
MLFILEQRLEELDETHYGLREQKAAIQKQADVVKMKVYQVVGEI